MKLLFLKENILNLSIKKADEKILDFNGSLYSWIDCIRDKSARLLNMDAGGFPGNNRFSYTDLHF